MGLEEELAHAKVIAKTIEYKITNPFYDATDEEIAIMYLARRVEELEKLLSKK